MTKSGTQGPIGRAKFTNFDFDHFFSRIEAFWVILSKKNYFWKIRRKWLSLEASKNCKGSVIQNSQKKVPDFGFNYLFSRIGPFWVIWTKKTFEKLTDHTIFPFSAAMAPGQKLYLYNPIFYCSWNFQRSLLAISSTISDDFSKIISVVF